MDLRGVFIFLFLIGCTSARPSKADTCGYESCNLGKPGFINVHLLPHTHDDVGWLKTVDQYYYGARNNIQQAGVQYIIDSVVTELSMDPSRRFIYVETAFFHQWWVEQTESTRNLVRQLVASGQLEFINGGWCMNDEAATHYVDIIDQMTLGLGILNDTFGECGRPRVAWQIDPFGHSREQASLAAQMGYDGLFFGRLDYADKSKRLADKTMEMVWRGSSSLGDAASIFTGVLFNTYFSPSGFCFDILCGDQPIIDDPQSRDYNVDSRVDEFLNFTQRQADAYATENILVTMGSDFTYQDANFWYKNMDKLIKYANARQASGSRFNLFYSTPSCYLKALNDAGRSWPVKTDDFFPYGSDPHAYWTGYFTSRPNSKYMIRQSSNLLQACKQAATFLQLSAGVNEGDYAILKEEVAVNQHHDAATGTEKQHVADDYARRLDIGIVECHKTIASYYKNAAPLGSTGLPNVEFCKLLNTSACSSTETNSQFVVNVYNPLARTNDRYIRLPVLAGVYQILDSQGALVTSQLVPLPSYVLNLPGRQSQANYELVFLASQLPPAGFKSYFVQKTAKSLPKHSTPLRFKSGSGRADSIISNERISVTVDEISGLIKSVSVDGTVFPLEQEYLWYEGFAGDNSEAAKRASGAYIFRPTATLPAKIVPAATVAGIFSGPLVHEIHQTFGSWVGQTIRLYQGQSHVELDWTVGPIPVADSRGKEIISEFRSNLVNNGVFYTDANGRQNVRRTRNTRETWTYNVTEPVSGNYYPINSHIFLNDGTNQLSVVTDRAQGGGSLRDGQLEVMVHRRLLFDDSFGVDEALNEMQYGLQGLVARGTHYLVLSSAASAARLYRPLGQELYKKPQVSFIPTSLSFAQWSALFKTSNQGVKALPANVNLLTLEPRTTPGTYLLRLEHIYEPGEDAALSQPVTVSIVDLLTGHTIVDAQELMLGGNQLKSDSNRLPWNVLPLQESNDINSVPEYEYQPLAVTDVVLQPMQIRTFVVTVA